MSNRLFRIENFRNHCDKFTTNKLRPRFPNAILKLSEDGTCLILQDLTLPEIKGNNPNQLMNAPTAQNNVQNLQRNNQRTIFE